MARPTLTAHRKFRRLTRALGSRLVARGALEFLWEACYEAGDDYVGTSEDLETLVGWDGEPGMLTRALIDAGKPEGVGFIEAVTPSASGQTSVAYRVHDLWHHAPDYVAKRRKRELDRQLKEAPVSLKRSDDRHSAPDGGQCLPTSDCLPGLDVTPAPAPAPARAPAQKNGSSTPHAAPEPALLEFPTVGKGPHTWALTGSQVAEWTRLYPGLNVLGECRAALAWANANPNKRKTNTGMPAFLVRWLTNSNDNGRSHGKAQHQGAKPLPSASDYDWECPHDPHCSARNECRVLQITGKGRKAG